MDFITVLPRTGKQHDSIMMVVENIMKAIHFILLKTTHKVVDVANIFMKEVARLNGIPKTIGSDRDTKFSSNLWKGVITLNCTTHAYLASGQLISLPCQKLLNNSSKNSIFKSTR
jgi:hypothetical protein